MNSRVQRSKDFVFSVLGPFLGQNMPIFAGCATLFLLMASFPLLIWVLVIVNHLPGYSITDVADLLYQFLPQVPEIQDVILEVLYGLNTQSTTFVASFAAVTMLYSASSGMYAIQKGLQRLTPGARYKLYDRLLAILAKIEVKGTYREWGPHSLDNTIRVIASGWTPNDQFIDTEDYAFALTFPAFTAGSEGEKLEFYFEAEIDGEDAWTVIEEELDAIAGIL